MKLYLSIAGFIFLAFLGGYFVYETNKNTIDEYAIPEQYMEQSNFAIGQYFFNQDENSEGPYDIQAAWYFYTKAVTVDDDIHPLLWYQLSRIDFIEGRFDDSLEKLQKQEELFGDDVPNLYYMRGLVYGYKAKITGDERDWREGEIAFKRFIELTPIAPWPRVDLAWLYFLQGRYDEMKPVLEEGIAFRPTNPWLLNMYGLALMNTGDKDGALVQFQTAQIEAEELTEDDWGKTYPGNNPEAWGQGLKDFKYVIAQNIALAQTE